MLVEILTGSKILILSSRKQVIAYEAIPHNLQIPHSLALYLSQVCMGQIVLISRQMKVKKKRIPYIRNITDFI